jgi:nucleoside-diphosphate-sugar epimerase
LLRNWFASANRAGGGVKVLIAGCGYVGTALGAELVKAGHEVWGLRRDLDAARALEGHGIRPLVANLSKPDTIRELPSADTLVLCQAPSRKNDEYRETYFEGTRNLLERFKGAFLRRVLLVSSTSVYSVTDGSWVNEATDPMAGSHGDIESRENAKTLLAQEELVLKSGHPSIVFRLAGIYGPGRNRVRSLLEGRAQPVLSDVYMNRIHLTDIARGLRLLLDKGTPGEIYLGADDAPCTQREFYTWVLEKLSLPLPKSAKSAEKEMVHGSNKRCSNGKLKELGLHFRFPSYKEGYLPLIEEVLSSSGAKSAEPRSSGWFS